ncbi:MAG: hypothetical protein MUQ65_03140 [Armatimonadetes bacterium]|nr:hypothetical protein [Armatimonadota bacterium]
MLRLLHRLYGSLAWRARRLLRILYHTEDVAFWGGDVGDAPWYPDLEKLDDIARNVGFEARKITRDDLELLREYHRRSGRPLGPRRIRKLHERWAAGDECYVAIDREGSVAACMWVAYNDHYIEAIHDVFPVGPSDVLSYDVDTRPDKRGSMGFLACSCASVAEGIRRGRRRGISWSSPHLFEEFRRVHWFSGLGTPHLFRIVRYRCICGLRFRSVVEAPEDDPDERPREDVQ